MWSLSKLLFQYITKVWFEDNGSICSQHTVTLCFVNCTAQYIKCHSSLLLKFNQRTQVCCILHCYMYVVIFSRIVLNCLQPTLCIYMSLQHIVYTSSIVSVCCELKTCIFYTNIYFQQSCMSITNQICTIIQIGLVRWFISCEVVRVLSSVECKLLPYNLCSILYTHSTRKQYCSVLVLYIQYLDMIIAPRMIFGSDWSSEIVSHCQHVIKNNNIRTKSTFKCYIYIIYYIELLYYAAKSCMSVSINISSMEL